MTSERKEKGEGVLVKSALALAAGGLVSKILGAAYRIPLTNILGGEGMGLYQMVFPLYCALLTFSSTGLPAALSKLTAESKTQSGILSRSLLLFGAIGLVNTLIMFVSGGFLSKLQGNAEAAACYRALSPSVFAVSLISCIRGYFQGKNNMAPTAVSQVLEQIFKAAFGIAACSFFGKSAAEKAAIAALAVTVSEIAALAFLFIRLKADGVAVTLPAREKGAYRSVISFTLPVALASLAMPLGHLFDSFTVINALGGGAEATGLYGLYSGSVAAITGVPVAMAYGVAAACVPGIAGGGKNQKILDSVRFTGVIAFPFAFFLMFFSAQCVDLLYAGMAERERLIAARILSLDALSVAFLSFLQTTNAILIAKGRPRVPLFSLFTATFLRVPLCIPSVRAFGINGAAITAEITYAVALAVNAAYIFRGGLALPALKDATKCLISAITCVLGGFLVFNAVGGTLAFIIISAAVFAVYFTLSAALGLFGEAFENFRFSRRVKRGGADI